VGSRTDRTRGVTALHVRCFVASRRSLIVSYPVLYSIPNFSCLVSSCHVELEGEQEKWRSNGSSLLEHRGHSNLLSYSFDVLPIFLETSLCDIVRKRGVP
jgi:hypothetical protein